MEAYATGGMDKLCLVQEAGMHKRAEELVVQMFEHWGVKLMPDVCSNPLSILSTLLYLLAIMNTRLGVLSILFFVSSDPYFFCCCLLDLNSI